MSEDHIITSISVLFGLVLYIMLLLCSYGGELLQPTITPSYGARDDGAHAKRASSSLVHRSLLEASFQVRNLDWREERLETDLQRIQHDCDTVAEERPKSRGHTGVIHTGGS